MTVEQPAAVEGGDLPAMPKITEQASLGDQADAVVTVPDQQEEAVAEVQSKVEVLKVSQPDNNDAEPVAMNPESSNAEQQVSAE